MIIISGHEILIVGYTDVEMDGGKVPSNSFFVQNSWGTG